MLVQSYSSLYVHASFIPPKCVDQREPKEWVKELCCLNVHKTKDVQPNP